MSISSTLINWYLQKKRDLPWRNTSDPFKIWMSEVILQQTRVAQGLAYYERFTEKYPNLKSLAEADEQDVLKLWQGLGYYSRARNMLKAAQYIVNHFDSQFPADSTKLQSIKGIGEYTAAAVGSFAFNLPLAVVDGNVNRVLTRVYGISEAIDSTIGKKLIRAKADAILNTSTPGLHNQAIMEFGALQCVPRNPNCIQCPLSTTCYANQHSVVEMLPVKAPKKQTRNRFFTYLVVRSSPGVWMRERTQNDIWKGLWEFPLIESDSSIDANSLTQHEQWQAWFANVPIEITKVSEQFTHKLSHQTIHAQFITIVPATSIEIPTYSLVNNQLMSQVPISKLIDNYLRKTETDH